MVRVVQELIGRFAPSECHDERSDNKICCLTFAHRPADECVVKQVADPCQIQFPIDAMKFADVSDPPQIRAIRSEIALQQIRCWDPPLIGTATPFLAGMRSNEPVNTHQPCDTMPANVPSGSAELAPHPWRTIGVT